MRIVEMGRAEFGIGVDHGRNGVGQGNRARTLHKLRRGPMDHLWRSIVQPSETLMESEIFGHERGAFTGAAERRIGCFELADAGTLLLDEIGEMPAPTQAITIARSGRPQSAPAWEQERDTR